MAKTICGREVEATDNGSNYICTRAPGHSGLCCEDNWVANKPDPTKDPIPKIVTIMSDGTQKGTGIFINGVRVNDNVVSATWYCDGKGHPRVRLEMIGVQVEMTGSDPEIKQNIIESPRPGTAVAGPIAGKQENDATDHGADSVHVGAKPADSPIRDPYWRPR